MRRNKWWIIAAILVLLAGMLAGCERFTDALYKSTVDSITSQENEAYAVLNNNQPQFTQDQLVTQSYEFYSEMDSLNRCGYAMACIGQDLMPTEDRGSIGQVKPTGWQTVKYDFVDGKYLYNRCHLIGFQLTGENANEKNLITGTRYMNVEGMLPFENMVADYIKETGNHVMYRVTPVFEETDLLAKGVQMEAWSVEDDGEGICFNVFVYNIQPGVVINYSDGTSELEAAEEATEEEAQKADVEATYVLNKKSKKFHAEDCSQADTIATDNRQTVTTTRGSLLNQGYAPAGCCEP